jgi:hypothetical protein
MAAAGASVSWAVAESEQSQCNEAFNQRCEHQRWLCFLKQNGEESEDEESGDDGNRQKYKAAYRSQNRKKYKAAYRRQQTAEESQEAEHKEEAAGDHDDVTDLEVKQRKLQKAEKRKLKKNK